MTAQTFTDIYDNGYRVESSECHTDAVYLTFLSNNPARWIANEDAPAVALAILEAAGCDKAGKTRLSRAMIALIEHISAEKVRAEREAEDAKADEYRRFIYRQANLGIETASSWHDFGAADQESWRLRYAAARKFFEEA